MSNPAPAPEALQAKIRAQAAAAAKNNPQPAVAIPPVVDAPTQEQELTAAREEEIDAPPEDTQNVSPLYLQFDMFPQHELQALYDAKKLAVPGATESRVHLIYALIDSGVHPSELG